MSNYAFEPILIDTVNKSEIITTLKDKEGNEIPIKETVEGLTEWILKNMKDKKGNNCQIQIYPLATHVMITALSKLFGKTNASLIFNSDFYKQIVIYSMMIGFYLSNWFQKKEIKICTTEKPLTDEQINKYKEASDTSLYLSLLSSLEENSDLFKITLDLQDKTNKKDN